MVNPSKKGFLTKNLSNETSYKGIWTSLNIYRTCKRVFYMFFYYISRPCFCSTQVFASFYVFFSLGRGWCSLREVSSCLRASFNLESLEPLESMCIVKSNPTSITSLLSKSKKNCNILNISLLSKFASNSKLTQADYTQRQIRMLGSLETWSQRYLTHPQS